MAADPLTARAVHGRLRLHVTGDGGRTRLASAVRTPPFHVQRLLYLDPARPALARIVLLNTTAGVFAGDRLDLSVRVSGGATVELTTPAMTRAFGMPDGHAEVSLLLIVECSYVEYLPEPTVLCRDADLRQDTAIELSGDAVVAAGEVVAFGRAAHGERHAYRGLSLRTEVCRGGVPLLAEALSLGPEDDRQMFGVLGGAAAFGSLQLVCGRCDPADELRCVRASLADGTGIWGGASLLAGDAGIAGRVLGDSAHATQAALRRLVAGFREHHAVHA